jgi:membrane protease YdiL (CAAX protease family)
MHWDFALILLFLGVAVPLLGRRRVKQLLRSPATTKVNRLSLYASTIAFQWTAAGIVLWRTAAHGISGSRLGLTIGNPVFTIAIAFIISIVVLFNQVFSLRRLASRPSEVDGTLSQIAFRIFPQDDTERLAFFALVATVSVCEELIYRGFVQRVFQQWSGGSVFVGIVGSAIYFSLAHLYQGRRGLVSTFAAGLIFSGVRAWSGSLLPSMVAHFIADITVGLLAPAKMRLGSMHAELPTPVRARGEFSD